MRVLENDKQQKDIQDETNLQSETLLLIILIVCMNFCIVGITKLIKRKYPRIGMFIQSAPFTLLIGFAFGIILDQFNSLSITTELRKSFQPLFVNIFLPFIIIDGAVNAVPQAKGVNSQNSFFRNIGKILVYAIPGTILTILLLSTLFYLGSVIGLTSTELTFKDSFIFASLISATDPVSVISVFKSIEIDQLLHSIIFGESILNDVIGFTSFNIAIDAKINDKDLFAQVWQFTIFAIFSMLWGYVFGLLTCLVCKYTGSSSQKDTKEDGFYSYDFAVMFISPWIAYLVAQTFDMSGIISIFFCGIALGQYAVRNLSPGCRKFTDKAYGSIAEVCEALCFLYIGISFYGFDYEFRKMDWNMTLYIVICLLLVRAIVVILCGLSIRISTGMVINNSFQTMIWFSGLRGAMAFVLALESISVYPSDEKELAKVMFMHVLTVATFNIVVQCPLIEPLIEVLGLATPSENNSSKNILEASFFHEKEEKLQGFMNLMELIFVRQKTESEIEKEEPFVPKSDLDFEVDSNFDSDIHGLDGPSFTLEND